MNEIPLISSDSDLAPRIEEVVAGCQSEPPEILLLKDRRKALDYLSIEMPELIFMNFPDPDLGAYALLDTIMSDPWLIHGGIIALCDDDDAVGRLEGIRGANLVVMLPPESLDRQLPRVLDIIHSNRRILFQRQIGSSLVREVSGHFKLNNDALEARCYTNLICNFLYNANRIDGATKDALSLAIYEMLVNAIEHGNCRITYEEKTEFLEHHGSMAGLIEQRCQDPDLARKKVTFEYTITPTVSTFFIADEGQGFNWREMADATDVENLLKPHGRGILLTKAVTQHLSYNDKGNEVRFEVAHQSDQVSMTPGVLKGMEPREIASGEIVFREGEPGNFLYYIVKGRYDVTVGGKTVAVLSPDDIFLGEMSFLLDNRRSATVRASTSGKLIEISKEDFVRAIKKYPHYALLLSRLLAQRIERTNKLYGAAAAG